jgi:hypothetical protein
VASSQAHVFTAELQHSGLGGALAAQKAATGSSAIAKEESEQLAVAAPAGGLVTTKDPENLLSSNVTTGETLLTIVDPSQLLARLFVPVSEMDHIRTGDPVSLQLPSQFSEIHGRLGTMEGSAVPLPPGVMANNDYKGIARPTFYTTRMPLGGSDSQIRPGLAGEAKIFSTRHSLAYRLLTIFGNILRTHFW